MANDNLPACLWFAGKAEEAAKFYVAAFKAGGRQAAITDELRWGEVRPEPHRDAPVGSILTVSFELEGRPFVALNGGTHFTHSPAVSFMVMCSTQKEIDYFWTKLQEGGGQPSQCGWLSDRFGLSWQVCPRQLLDMHKSPDRAAAERAMKAMLAMTKLDLPALTAAFEGKA
jgi:predicted 3-demethylubiquinone-9 3-methyltransferase (glyoxalase superfamily)